MQMLNLHLTALQYTKVNSWCKWIKPNKYVCGKPSTDLIKQKRKIISSGFGILPCYFGTISDMATFSTILFCQNSRNSNLTEGKYFFASSG